MLSIGISLVIFVWAFKLFRESTNVLLESAPRGIDVEEISRTLRRHFMEIVDVHDVHVWEITSKMYVMTAHLKLEKERVEECVEILKRVNKLLDDKYDIAHTTIQCE